MYNHLKVTDLNSVMHIILDNNLKDYNSILQRNINEAKKMCYNNKFQLCVYNIKKTWMTMDEILNKCKNNNNFPSYV